MDALSATELAGCAPERVALVGMVPEAITDHDHVDIDAAALSWRTAAAGTGLEGAALDWQRALDHLCCFTCGHEYDGRPLDP